MTRRMVGLAGLLTLAVAASPVAAQRGNETFTAMASVQGDGGGTATAPVTIVVTRTMAKDEADGLVAAFKSGGGPGLRKALAGVAPTGSVQLGSGKPTPTRLTIERTTDRGRLLTIVADQPLAFLGAGLPGAPPKAGYDFAVVDLLVDDAGTGAGTLAPAAKVKLEQGAFVVDDYGAAIVRLEKVKKQQ